MVAGAQSGEPIAVGEQLMQLDQAITLTLQEIDENFSQAHQAVTSRILPAIKDYESACQRTWVAARFWKQFFEASAQVSLSQQPLEDMEEAVEGQSEAYAYADPDAVPHQEDTAYSDSAQETRDSNPLQSPPRLSHSLYAPREEEGVSSAQMDTPFERLKRDVEQSGASTSLPARREAPMLASDMSVSMANDPSMDVSRVPKSSSPLKRNTRRRSSARPRVSIVGDAAANPFSNKESARMWDGIADLRTTPLRSASTQRTRTSEPGQEDSSLQLPEGMSPPVTMQFSVPRSKYQETPAKDAAKLVVDDLLRSVGGEAEASSPSQSARRKSVVGTPLTRRTPQRARRDSLPTPPTITKVRRAPDDASDDRSGLADDAGDAGHSGQASQMPGMLDKMLALEDHDSDSDSNASDEAAMPPAGAQQSIGSGSRSIEDDTLFGAAKRLPSTQTPHTTRSLSQAVRRSSDEMRLLGL